MRRRKNKDFLFKCLFLLLIGILLFESYQLFQPDEKKKDASLMLFEVVNFEMEILNSSLMESVQINNTNELDRLKLAAYSASFGHERMVKVFGEDQIVYLPAIEKLVNMITGWQIGGDRPLSMSEKNILVEFSAKFAEIVSIYAILVDSDRGMTSTQADKLATIGQQLDDIISQ
ncbi:hypothetical protein [Paenibacillus crassostreae]|uniref:S-adenosylmethionine decarboxylase n=1 Tax=Paenibacillus crassostreae TaxID=1763538 RepID=A0A167EDY5_9BACL|nr:hypothetical protein [Paenibacillus crassostreae]AOZ91930.1 hypothetical protein LPB68_06660 [Paenibacillus crassostreae]OAB75439.1 hypothetical protein PNBC_08735 [Paenibacillus crassostreae]